MSYTHKSKSGKKIGGTAALLHEIKNQGGLEEYEKNLMIKGFMTYLNNGGYEEIKHINEPRQKFRVIK
jgi:hypothetical protein